MPRFGKPAALLMFAAAALLGACRQWAPYGSAASDRGPHDAAGDMQIAEAALLDRSANPGDGPRDARGDVPGAHILFVDDDWAGAAAGDAVFPGASFGDNAFATINDALLAAMKALEQNLTISVIEVRAGTYPEKVLIKLENLTLRGVGRPVLRQIPIGAAVGETVVSIAAPGVTVVGFEIDAGGNGIGVNCPQSNVTIRDNHVHGMVNAGGRRGVGILVWGDCSNVLIRGNNVHDNDRQGIYLGRTDPTIIATDCTIRDNIVRDNGRYTLAGLPGPDPYGIQVHFAERTEVRGNTISGQNLTYTGVKQGAGIWLTGQDNQVLENDISGCLDGIWVGATENPSITGNTLHGNAQGLVFTDSWWGQPLATGNIFCGNTIGLRNIRLSGIDAQRCWWDDPAGANKMGEKAIGQVDTTNHQTTRPTKGPCSAP